MGEWDKRVLKLKPRHGWKARPGYRIFVADKGAVRFDFPQDWILNPGSKSITLYDRQPPEDNCRLEISVMRLPPLDWSVLPLSRLVQDTVNSDERAILCTGDIHQIQHPDCEQAWMEIVFVDPNEQREARSRICLARGANVQSLITMDFWADDAARLSIIWDEILSTLEFGRYVEDPSSGPIVQ